MTSSDPTKILVFDRTPVARLISCAAAFAAPALVFSYLAQGPGEIEAAPLAGLLLLTAGTFAAAVLQYGDHIYVSDEGVMYENRVLSLFGRKGSWMRWEDIVAIREIREKVLVVLSRDGRRLLVDSIFGYAIARAEIVRRASLATVSGTLARDED